VTRREQAILRSAEKLFFERSFDGVGVDDIGRAAGLSGSSIYRHFASKDEILATLFDEVIEAILLRMGLPDPDPQRDLEGLLRAYVDLAVTYERLAAIWIREQRSLSERHRRDHDRRQRRVNDRLVLSLERCYPARTRDEVVTVARGLQLLLLSESLRPPGGRRAPDPEEMLFAMAVGSLAALGDPQERNASKASSSAAGASNIG
jgi:AcrR family transcriptional regulator